MDFKYWKWICIQINHVNHFYKKFLKNLIFFYKNRKDDGDLDIQDELGKTSFFIEIEPKNITENQIKVLINVKSNGVLIEQVKSNFVAPVE